jgi:hypothetical protein
LQTEGEKWVLEGNSISNSPNQPFSFCWLYIPKKRNLALKCDKIKFFDTFNSQNSTKVHEKFPALDTCFKSVAKNIEGCLKDLTFIFIFAALQIWLNLLMDDWHFSNVTKLTKITHYS